jgi:uncharacterized protein YicC (UPF0701 family)
MKAKSSIRLAYRNFLHAGRDMRNEIQKHLVRGKLPASIVADLAEEHSECYHAHAEMLETGAYRFYKDAKDTTSANRHEAATKQWNRVIAPFIGVKDKRGGSRNKAEVLSVVDKLVQAYDKLSNAERAKFRKLAGIE